MDYSRCMSPRIGVVIAAHNEEQLIGRVLSAIREGGSSNEIETEIEIVVVVNGTTDRTVERARAFAGVIVVEVDEASKIAALNAGDAASSVFPRMYLDADVVISREAVLAVADVLAGGEPRVAAPTLHIDSSRSSWLVRQYYEVDGLTDFRSSGHIGSGVYAVSRTGRERWAEFPQVIADDRFVQQLFLDDERIVLADHAFTIEAPRTIGAITHRGVRIAIGNRQLPAELQNAKELPASQRQLHLVRRVLARPRLWFGFVVYSIVYATIQYRAKRRLDRGIQTGWNRDMSTRGIED
jgi:glycosyltransferase involved in cell wall biosynthesis